MTSSLTVAFTSIASSSSSSTILQANFLPEIMLDEDRDYSCALLDLIIKDSKNLEKIIDLGVIHINCDIISKSYINGEQSHTIHQFVTSTLNKKDQIFVEIPKHLNYFPIKVKRFHSIQISITDEKGQQIDITGGHIICRINIRRDYH